MFRKKKKKSPTADKGRYKIDIQLNKRFSLMPLNKYFIIKTIILGLANEYNPLSNSY